MSYKVKKGDTLSKIAKEHGLSLSELLKLNKIPQDKANSIRIGQEIKISSNPIENRKAALVARMTTKPSAKKEDIQTPKQESVLVRKPVHSNIQVIDAAYLKNNAKQIQQQLLTEKFDIGKTGADGIWGKASQSALDKARAAGYKLVNGKLVKPETNKNSLWNSMGTLALGPMGAYTAVIKANAKEPAKKTKEQDLQEQLVKAGYDLGLTGADGIWGKRSQLALNQAQKDGYEIIDGKLIKPTPSLKEKAQTLVRKTTPRTYTAAQNTIGDLIAAPVKRLVGKITNPEIANKVFPTEIYDERHLSSELYDWLQDAVDKKWNPEDRKKYFEKNPDAQINKGWIGRLGKNTPGQSDYQRYYGEAYTGPVVKGFGATMFGTGLDQAQGTLGSFNIVYTKDGAYIEDSWDFGTGSKFDTSTLMGTVRQMAEDYGSQEQSDIQPTRAIKAKIKYR